MVGNKTWCIFQTMFTFGVIVLYDLDIYILKYFMSKANDFDVGDNSNVSYSAIDNSNSDRIFQIDKKTGWILSAKSFIGKVGQNFRLKILAVDNGGKQPHYNDTTIVNVWYILAIVLMATYQTDQPTYTVL